MQSFAVAAICLLVGRSQAARNSELVQTTLGDATEPARIHGLASDDDDAKCEAVVKGSKASRLGSVLGGLKDAQRGMRGKGSVLKALLRGAPNGAEGRLSMKLLLLHLDLLSFFGELIRTSCLTGAPMLLVAM
eukprot:631246-Amphidinium_carterae.1